MLQPAWPVRGQRPIWDPPRCPSILHVKCTFPPTRENDATTRSRTPRVANRPACWQNACARPTAPEHGPCRRCCVHVVAPTPLPQRRPWLWPVRCRPQSSNSHGPSGQIVETTLCQFVHLLGQVLRISPLCPVPRSKARSSCSFKAPNPSNSSFRGLMSVVMAQKNLCVGRGFSIRQRAFKFSEACHVGTS